MSPTGYCSFAVWPSSTSIRHEIEARGNFITQCQEENSKSVVFRSPSMLMEWQSLRQWMPSVPFCFLNCNAQLSCPSKFANLAAFSLFFSRRLIAIFQQRGGEKKRKMSEASLQSSASRKLLLETPCHLNMTLRFLYQSRISTILQETSEAF